VFQEYQHILSSLIRAMPGPVEFCRILSAPIFNFGYSSQNSGMVSGSVASPEQTLFNEGEVLKETGI
jgi:hypothetical protein